jgi:hypothetical protein
MSKMNLLGWRLRLAVMSWRGRGRRRRIISLSIGFVLASALFLVTRAMFVELTADPNVASIAPLAVTAALHATFLFSLLRDTAGAMGHLFLSRDGGFLLSSPLGPGQVLTVKGLEAVADAIPAPAGTALPIVLAYGSAVNAGPEFFLSVPLVFLLLLLLTVETGFLLAFAVAPIAPPGRLRHLLSVASTLLFLACWLVLLWLARSPDVGFLDQLAGPDAWPRAQALLVGLPSTWAAGELIGIAGGASPPGAGLIRLALVGTALAVALVFLSRGYPRIWQMAQEARRRRPRVVGATVERVITLGVRDVASAEGDRSGLVSLITAFLRRDSRLLRREPGMLTDMGVLVVMTAFLPVLLAPSLRGVGGGEALFLWAAMIFVSVELGYELGSRALPLERQAIYWVLAAPISAAALLATRTFSLWLLGLPWIGLVALVGSLGLGLGPGVFLRGAALGGLLLVISLPVGLAAGVYLGRPDWRHPRQMLTLGGRMILLALLVTLAGGFWITLRLSSWSQRPEGALVAGDLVMWGSVLAGCAAVTAICSWLAWRRLRGLEWLY